MSSNRAGAAHRPIGLGGVFLGANDAINWAQSPNARRAQYVTAVPALVAIYVCSISKADRIAAYRRMPEVRPPVRPYGLGGAGGAGGGGALPVAGSSGTAGIAKAATGPVEKSA